jgi:hypothetical protein
MSRSAPTTRTCLALFLLALCAVAPGCVHRRMTIESNPAGALVLLDGKEAGYTPVSVDFTYYGTREVTLIKDGYETQTFPARLQTPWYQHIPLDFFSDNFSPVQITNRHRFRYQLKQRYPLDDTDEKLLDRGNAFRSEALIGQ